MSKETIKHKKYTVVKESLSGWYEWVIYAPADAGICGGVKEFQALNGENAFLVEFFKNGEIVGFQADSIEAGIELQLGVAK